MTATIRGSTTAPDLDFARENLRPVLRALLEALRGAGYEFVVPTPETHGRVLRRDTSRARSLRDAFGWNKPFDPDCLGALFAPLRAAGVIERRDGLWRSRIRVASASGDLFLHSAYPTDAADAVFLGPDSYRFIRFLRDRLHGETFERAIDFGAGTGIGGVALTRVANIRELVLIDVNPQALALARLNAEFAGVAADVIQADGFKVVPRPVDLVIGNPPFIAESGKTYSDGGAGGGIEAALDWAKAAQDVLVPGGRMVLYSGSPITNGRDELLAQLTSLAKSCGARLHYEEIDPDIFGEELSGPAYRQVDRIAAVGADIGFPR